MNSRTNLVILFLFSSSGMNILYPLDKQEWNHNITTLAVIYGFQPHVGQGRVGGWGVSSVSPSWTSLSASYESPTPLPSLECCDTKLTYSSSGHPDAFYLKVAETNTNITGQCPGSCVYVKYVMSSKYQ